MSWEKTVVDTPTNQQSDSFSRTLSLGLECVSSTQFYVFFLKKKYQQHKTPKKPPSSLHFPREIALLETKIKSVYKCGHPS